jgi:hypothetical protein
MFRTGLLLITGMCYVDYTSCCLYTVDPPDDDQQAYSKHVEAYWVLPATSQHKEDYTNCCLYTVDPPDDEQKACSKHVEAYY